MPTPAATTDPSPTQCRALSDTIAEALDPQVGTAHSEAFGRMLHYLRRARVRRVDLRTAAALGFTVPGEPPRWLPVAPLGRALHPEAMDGKSVWWPATLWSQDFWRARHGSYAQAE
ncbi:hypothetical protein ACOZ38_29225 [Sphaerisporangium viridialbum]|uniref:hypothetical protein n=1 Tax=Sphaerisporangium viridialbum TaxID=46189 RepID=UPI003C756B60